MVRVERATKALGWFAAWRRVADLVVNVVFTVDNQIRFERMVLNRVDRRLATAIGLADHLIVRERIILLKVEVLIRDDRLMVWLNIMLLLKLVSSSCLSQSEHRSSVNVAVWIEKRKVVD